MDEWQLQDWLTRTWAEKALTIAGRRYCLIAWEVMAPSWDINYYRGRWNEPSVDFLAADEYGQLPAIELKRAIGGPAPAADALLQVTRKALLLSRSFTPDNLERAHATCFSGRYGRLSIATLSASAWHQQHFGLKAPVPMRARPMRRGVLATKFGASWAATLQQIQLLAWNDLAALRTVGREGRLLREMSPAQPGELEKDVYWGLVAPEMS